MQNFTLGNKASCKAFNRTGCTDGVILKLWDPINEISGTDCVLRSLVYFLVLSYLFLGVSIIADIFMGAIEMITSQERQYQIQNTNGIKETVYVRIWNETVSNLTLMALGSSAPEILLSIIETIGKNFEAGELGPGTIVGSAAFNLFIIIGICVMVIPKEEVRKTKHLTVFIVTTIWSLLAYIWLYLILAVITPGIVNVWEAVLTFIFFPLTVITAYFADTKLYFKNYLATKVVNTSFQARSRNTSSKSEDKSALPPSYGEDHDLDYMDGVSSSDESIKIHSIKMEYLDVIKEIKATYDGISLIDLEIMAEEVLLKRQPKSRAYYKMKAMQYLTGTPCPIRKAQINSNVYRKTDDLHISDKQELVFTPDHYSVYESSEKVKLCVKRFGEFIDSTVVEVDYFTEEGTAKEKGDYVSTKGTLNFDCGQTEKEIIVEIVNDDIYEEDEYFFVRLSEPRLVKCNHVTNKQLDIKLGCLKFATVMILDDDHGGIFYFESSKISVTENIGNLEIKVIRSTGARGEVSIPVKTIDNTAINGVHYHNYQSHLMFRDNETEHQLLIKIYDENEFEKDVQFVVELGEPQFEMRPNELKKGYPGLGDTRRVEISISENPDLKEIINKLIEKGRLEKVIVTSTWKEQFKKAFTIEADEDSSDMPSCSQYIIHYLSLFWKILFSLVPPPDIWNGWLCFIVSIIVIGLLTAIIGDAASFFGCHVGLSDSVTAITFVALGTSLPDTFASKVAALNDKTADASIGNVMGSNAVNVFLGIGIAWTMASVFHAAKGDTFYVDSGSLGFSVTLFTILAMIAISIMLLRRTDRIGGELGGPSVIKYLTGIVFCMMWFFYVLLSSLEIYCHIKGF